MDIDLYLWVRFTHIASLMVFFVAHGASAAVAFRLRRERDLARVRALLELSASSVGLTMSVSLLVAFATGIWLGFLGGFWDRGWIWASLALFIAVAGLMTPIAAIRLSRMRAAAGIARGKAGEIPPADPAELERLLAGWSPMPVAILGFGAIAVITWLMVAKPF
jgi:uncharacterized membrane protein